MDETCAGIDVSRSCSTNLTTITSGVAEILHEIYRGRCSVVLVATLLCLDNVLGYSVVFETERGVSRNFCVAIDTARFVVVVSNGTPFEFSQVQSHDCQGRKSDRVSGNITKENFVDAGQEIQDPTRLSGEWWHNFIVNQLLLHTDS